VTERNEDNRLSAGFAHVGVTVEDLDEAIEWYREILGLELLSGPAEVSSSDSRVGDQVRDVFGREVVFRQAHLLLADGTALELFEFTDPPVKPPANPFAFGESGFWHICLYRRDVEQIVARIAKSKGRVRNSRVWEVIPGEPYKMCYCEDPSGNVVEIYSHSHAEVFGGRQGYEHRRDEGDD
jgi:catechol 2,3-dioxygenase-like lactoylglutathione lyase family enzyme